MRYQSIWLTDADFDRVSDILMSSKAAKSCFLSQKGLLVFSLKKFPDARLQLSSKGKLNVYHGSYGELHEILNALKKLFVSEQGKTAQFKLLKMIPFREVLMETYKDKRGLLKSLDAEILGSLIEQGLVLSSEDLKKIKGNS